MTVKKRTSQVSDIILDSCMQSENYPIKTVGKEAFYSYYVSYHISKLKKSPNFQKSVIVKKSTSQVSDIILDACMQLKTIRYKL